MDRWLILLVVGLASCGGSDGPGAPAVTADTGTTPVDGSVDGAPADASADGVTEDGSRPDGVVDDGAILDGATTESGAPVAANCSAGHAWKAWKPVLTGAIGRLGGISATGLTLGWTLVGGAGATATRLNELAVFGKPVDVPGTATTIGPLGRLALDASGETIVGPGRDPRLVVWTGSSSWAVAPSDARFADVLSGLAADDAFSEPMFSASGKSFFYLITPKGGVPKLHESRWNDATSKWSAGSAISDAALASVDSTHRRRPTGMAGDDLTLFFFDEPAGKQRAAWRATRTSAFTYFEDLEAFPEAVPNAACTFLYFKGVDDKGSAAIVAAQ